MGCTDIAACPRRSRAQPGYSHGRLYIPSRALVVMVMLLLYAAHSAATNIQSEELDMSTPTTPAACTETSECTLADVLSAIEDIEDLIHRKHDYVVDGIDTLWILFATTLIIFMQAGFAMLEAGAVRSKNIRSILLKNLFDFAVGTVAFWFCGYALAFGDSWKHFMGTTNFFLVDVSGKDYAHFIFQLPFAATATTIVSGSMAERTRLSSYLLQALLLTGFTTPMVMHWCWNEDGVFSARRAQPFLGTGFIDFAGSGVVHMVGGLAGVTGAYVAGQRHDENGVLRFDSMRARDFIGHNAIYSTLGMFVLWVGWYGFNAGSTRQIVGSTDTVGRVFINTTLATAFSTITTFAWESRHGYALASCLNGTLAGLVAVSGACALVDGWAACVIGVVGAGAYHFGSWLLLRLRIDDPLDASPLHFCCGLLGVVSVGLFSKLEYLESVYGITNEAHAGAFLGGDGTLLAAQLVTAACVCAWTMGTCMASLCVIKYLPKLLRLTDQADCLRVPLKQELAGLDVSYHAGWEFPPYLMPLVENLRALTQVQEKLAEQATHVGSYGDLLGQMGAEDRDESHINSVGRTTNTLDTEQSLTTLGSKLSSDVAKKSSTSGSEHMIMLHEALAKVNTPSAVTDAYRLREEMRSMRGVPKGASKFWRKSKELISNSDTEERRELEASQRTVDGSVRDGNEHGYTDGTEETSSNGSRRPGPGNIPHGGLDAEASVQSVTGKVLHWSSSWVELPPRSNSAGELSVELPARDGSEEEPVAD